MDATIGAGVLSQGVSLSDEQAMQLALAQAHLAAQIGEVPIGAVVVRQGQVIAQAHNAPIANCDPSAHAEVLALRQAAQALCNYRLDDCTLFVTAEPCVMCAGALRHARVKRLVYACAEPRTGAIESLLRALDLPTPHPPVAVTSGVLAHEASALLKSFFHQKREQQHGERPSPLPDHALRTPDAAFEALETDRWLHQYRHDLPSLKGLRLHFLDSGPREAPRSWLLLHGNRSWGWVWRHALAPLLAHGHRVVIPDLIGFGRSDKPKKTAWHAVSQHLSYLKELIQLIDLKKTIVVSQGQSEVLAKSLVEVLPNRMLATCAMPSWLSDPLPKACELPFPDAGHRAAISALDDLWPKPRPRCNVGHLPPEDDAEQVSRWARQLMIHFPHH